MTKQTSNSTAQLRPNELETTPPVIDTVAALDALSAGSVIRSKRGCVWMVDDEETDGTELRYAGAGVNDYRTGRVLLELYGPFTAIWLEV